MWPFQNKETEISQRELLETEKKQQLVNAALDPRSNIDDEAKAMRKDQYALIMKWQQDRTESLRDMFMGFAGLKIEKKDNILQYVSDPFNKRICSVWGAKKLTEFIRPQDHNAMLANWDDKKINSELMSISESVMDFITLNNDDMEISINHFEFIVDEIVLAQHPTYQRGFNDGERRVVKETIKVSEVSTGRPEKQQQKVFGIPISSQ